MNCKNNIIRKAKIDDIEQIYDLCCKVELTCDIEKMSRNGFLMNSYTIFKELKKVLIDLVKESQYFYVYIYQNKIIAFLIGSYTKENEENRLVEKMTGSGKINFDKNKLKKLGIKISFQSDYAMLDKIAVDPDYRGMRIAEKLLKRFALDLKKLKIKYILSEIIEKVYDGDKLLKLKNYASLRFHKKIGAVKIGDTDFYSDNNTYLRNKGKFRDGIYLIDIDKLLI